MENPKYNWKRYWVPRDGGFAFDTQGFLLPSGKDAEWARIWKTDVVAFDDLLTTPCLILLGEPGIGKTHAIDQVVESITTDSDGKKLNILVRNLNSYSTDFHLVDDIFRSSEFLTWQNQGGELHVFLDSFDECLIRVDSVAETLATHFERLPSVSGLFIRIASRTAEWSTSLEDKIYRILGKESVGVYELAPLTRDQVSEAARAWNVEEDRFILDIIKSEVVSFAIKPVTLNLLIRVWKKRGGRLPPTQREIYQEGCLELCRDTDSRQSPKLHGKLSAEQRFAIAAHVAAATFFCNRSAVWTSNNESSISASDISVGELIGGAVTCLMQNLPVSKSAIKETLDTGLFTSRGRNRLGWSHQTYGEFLAAHYLIQESLNAIQIRDLLIHSADDAQKLIPQLHETAAWAAAPDSDLFAHLIKVQPEVLLKSDVITIDHGIKKSIVDSLLNGFSSNSVRGDWWAMREQYAKLSHPTLSSQIRGFLKKRDVPSSAKIEVIYMVEKCQVNNLMPFLVKMALDKKESTDVRVRAAVAVVNSGDEKTKKKLRPLALGNTGDDPKHSLRGAGLNACWPQHMTADELFYSLVKPDHRYYGVYHDFFRNKPMDSISLIDLPRALEWVEKLPQLHSVFDRAFADLSIAILDRAVDFIENDKVKLALAGAILSLLRRHFFHSDNKIPRLKETLETNPVIRLGLAQLMIQAFQDDRRDALNISGWGLPVVLPADLPWLIEKINLAASIDIQRRYAHLIRLVFYPNDTSDINALISASVVCPVLVEIIPHWLQPMDLQSNDAQKARDLFLEEEQFKKETVKRNERLKRDESKKISPSPAEQVVALLRKAESGDLSKWWKISCWLEIERNGYKCKDFYRMDISQLVGWKAASDEDKARMLELAQRYLFGFDPEPDQWFSRQNISWRPAVAGFRALLLLSNLNPGRYETLSTEVWRQWVPVILRLKCFEERDDHGKLTCRACDIVPMETAVWAVKVIRLENKESEYLSVLDKLPEKWPVELQSELFTCLRKVRLKPNCYEQLLKELLERGVVGVLDFTRSKLKLAQATVGKRKEITIRCSRLLMRYGDKGGWSRIWEHIKKDPNFGTDLIQGMQHEISRPSPEIFRTMYEKDIGQLWEWMERQFPTVKDPDRSQGGMVTPRWAIANFRDSLISHLADVGTEAGCLELGRLSSNYPQFGWFEQVLLRGQEQYRRKTWQPITPDVLFRLASMNGARLVQSGSQLLNVVIKSLNDIQSRLQGEMSEARFLWNKDKHKSEEELSDWIKIRLDDDLKKRGLVINREVQIHGKERTDIHVTATTKNPKEDFYGDVKVIIEVKGDWHPELMTAMKDQLVDRYLKNNDCRHGIYLVGWFQHVDPRDSSGKNGLDRLQQKYKKQAEELTNSTQTIRAIVMDCSIPKPEKKKKTAIKKKRTS